MKVHTVESGDCFASLAKQYGFHKPEIIYNDAANANLKTKRKNMHVLNAKDVVIIPKKESKSTPLTVQSTATFLVKGIVTEFIVVVEDFQGNALKNKTYALNIEGAKFEGKTDASGSITHKVDASATAGELTVYLDKHNKNNLYWTLVLGGLTPHDETDGLVSRLHNLGYSCNRQSGNEDISTKAAVRAFKCNHGLGDDDIIDQATKDKVHAIYGF